MSEAKYYERKINGVIAIPLRGKENASTTVMINQSGNYDPAYHGSIVSGMIGNAYAGDYLVYVANGIWTVVKKEEFESLYEVNENVTVKEYQTGMFKIDTILIPSSDPDAAKEAFAAMLSETEIKANEPAVVFTEDPFAPKILGPSDVAPTTMDSIRFVDTPEVVEKPVEKAEPKKKRKSFRE